MLARSLLTCKPLWLEQMQMALTCSHKILKGYSNEPLPTMQHWPTHGAALAWSWAFKLNTNNSLMKNKTGLSDRTIGCLLEKQIIRYFLVEDIAFKIRLRIGWVSEYKIYVCLFFCREVFILNVRYFFQSVLLCLEAQTKSNVSKPMFTLIWSNSTIGFLNSCLSMRLEYCPNPHLSKHTSTWHIRLFCSLKYYLTSPFLNFLSLWSKPIRQSIIE